MCSNSVILKGKQFVAMVLPQPATSYFWIPDAVFEHM